MPTALSPAQAAALKVLEDAQVRGDIVVSASKNSREYCRCCYTKIDPTTARSLARKGLVTVGPGRNITPTAALLATFHEGA